MHGVLEEVDVEAKRGIGEVHGLVLHVGNTRHHCVVLHDFLVHDSNHLVAVDLLLGFLPIKQGLHQNRIEEVLQSRNGRRRLHIHFYGLLPVAH